MDNISVRNIEHQKYILLAGTKKIISDEAYKRSLALTLGKYIIKEQDWILFNGGALSNCDSCIPSAIDYYGAFGADKYAKSKKIDPQNKIFTLLPQNSNHCQHNLGKIEISKKKTSALRRFDLVAKSDAIITIEGGEGVLNILELGISLNKPVLPISFTGGSSEKVWETYESEILSKFNISVSSPEVRIIKEGSSKPSEVASTAISIIKRALRPVCFIIMPYREKFNHLYTNYLLSAISESGFLPVRADFISSTGSILYDMVNAIK